MDFLSNIVAVSQPSGMWGTIINAFESGVGSYLLAIVLITLIVRLILIPLDTVNKKYNKKMTDAQAKLAPEVQRINKQYANDPKLANQKTQELYKKNGATVGGGCLIMLVFMVLNLTIFFTLFSSLNGFSAYKINQQYLSVKDTYVNTLEFINKQTDLQTFLENYNDIRIVIDNDTIKAIVGESQIGESATTFDNYVYYKEANITFTKQTAGTEITVEGYDDAVNYVKVTIELGTEEEPNTVYYYINKSIVEKIETPSVENPEEMVVTYKLTSDVDKYFDKLVDDEYYEYLIRTYVNKEVVEEGKTPKYEFKGDTKLDPADENSITYAQAIETILTNRAQEDYEVSQKDNKFLWIKNIWIADSPLKNSIFTFSEYKAQVGANNVSAQEEVIYDSIMNPLRGKVGRANGYFILAIISIGISALSMWLTQRKTKKVNPAQKTGWMSLIIMPAIMGIFAIMYNSVFAIYMIVGQVITLGATPLQDLIIKKWEGAEQKRADKKTATNKNSVDYRRK